MTRRVVIGRQGDGQFGLTASLHGVDALFADYNDPTQVSFDTRWSDRVTLHQIGIANLPLPNDFTTSLIPWPNLGYTPFFEIRRVSGVTVYDDRPMGDGSTDVYGTVRNYGAFIGARGLAGTFFYIAYKIPAPINSPT